MNRVCWVIHHFEPGNRNEWKRHILPVEGSGVEGICWKIQKLLRTIRVSVALSTAIVPSDKHDSKRNGKDDLAG